MITTQTYQMNAVNMPQVIYTQSNPMYQPVQQVMVQQPLTYVQQPMMLQPQMVAMPQVMGPMVYYRNNQQALCPNCQTPVITSIKYEPGPGTWIMCVAMGMCLGPFGALVFCIDDCKDCQHYCNKCGGKLGRIRFLLDE